MKKIILCEGKTDAILISYFLEKFEWQFSKKVMQINLPVDKDNEVFSWYRHPNKPDQELAIWGVGGYSNIQLKLKYITESIQSQPEKQSQNRFNKIVLFVDNDTGSFKEHISDMDEWFKSSGIDLLDKIELQEWLNAEVELLGNQQKYPIQLLSIILPPESKGNLEVFLLNALKESSSNDGFLVEEAEKFINKIPKEPYLLKSRLRQKAWLGSVLSVMSPDWVFTSLDERLKKVNWENLELAFTAYQKLRDL
jgi:hypothetical protein